MTEHDTSDRFDDEGFAESSWVDDLLLHAAEHDEPPGSPGFVGRCREAAFAAQQVRSMRASATRMGFAPMPLSF